MRTKQRRWIGCDGEGVGRSPHRYILLACSDGDYIQDRNGLGTEECLDFFCSIGTRDARLCGYYLGYDWTKILSDLPDDDLHRLLRPELRARPKEQGGGFEWINWEGYRLHFLAHAMWIGRRSRRKKTRAVAVWDLGRYYQGPFVDALKAWNIAPDVQDRIKAMKEKRDSFKWSQHKQIREYCLQECRALAEMATQLEAAHVQAQIFPRSWHGPGSTAGALLARHGIKEKRGSLPPHVQTAALVAYFGGRAEIAGCGQIERPVFAYDITSAYPYHATGLPCLLHGKWARVRKEKEIKAGNVVAALVAGSIERCKADWGPLPVRLKNGSIVYPQSGASGVWHRSEWLAARDWPDTRLKFDHAFVLRQECECEPFAFIESIFAERLRVGKNSGAGQVLKLAINSVYGKLAQSVGEAQYASPFWAGMITAGTRAQVLDLMAAHKRLDSVLMVATDGLFTTEPRDVGPVRLGGWERTDYPKGITIVRPGIYWSPDGKLRARGLGRGMLSAEARSTLIDAFANDRPRVILPKRTVFGGARMMIARNRAGECKRSRYFGQWYQIPTRVSLLPAPKRRPDWGLHALDGAQSTPYGKSGLPASATGGRLALIDLLSELTL